jgi:hypothetical protein
VSKKTNKKKKVNIKLESGQTFLIEDLQILLHVQKTYATLLGGQVSPEEKAMFMRIVNAVNAAIENVYVATDGGLDDEDYWN